MSESDRVQLDHLRGNFHCVVLRYGFLEHPHLDQVQEVQQQQDTHGKPQQRHPERNESPLERVSAGSSIALLMSTKR